MPASFTRRHLLGLTAIALGHSSVALAAPGWPANAAARTNPRRLIVVFLRGAVDGLSVVAPYQESNYRALRPGIALAMPGQPGGVLPLTDIFGLHPALASMMPLWQSKQLAFIHASGSPDPTRSHFDAQDYMETALPGSRSASSGWMNRLLATLPTPSTDHANLQALNFGSTMPRILQGKAQVASLEQGNGATRRMAIDQPQMQATFDALYDGKDALSRTYREATAQRHALQDDLGMIDAEQKKANNGAPASAKGLGIDTQRLGALMRNNPAIRLGFIGVGGWDTHVNQGDGTKGVLMNNLQPLGASLMALQQALGPVWHDTAVMVMSEFGRTVRQNGTGGTDHGHGNVMWLLGGNVRGGQVYGDWPGLGETQLYQGRDLAITTDFRAVLAATLQQHLRLPDTLLAQVLSQGRFAGSNTLRTLFA